jgi:hypothetical protein
LITTLVETRSNEGWFIAVELLVLFIAVADIVARFHLIGWLRFSHSLDNWLDLGAILLYTITLCLALSHLDQDPRVAETEGIIGEVTMIARNSYFLYKLKYTLDTIQTSMSMLSMVDYGHYKGESPGTAKARNPTFGPAEMDVIDADVSDEHHTDRENALG